MTIATGKPDAASALTDSLAQRIWKRTNGQIKRLRVESTNGRIVVHGATPSYYVKQLVLQAILEADVNAGGFAVVLEVEVPG